MNTIVANRRGAGPVWTPSMPEIQSDALVINAIVERVRPEKPEGARRLGFTNKLWSTVELCWLEDCGARPSAEVIFPCLKDATVFWNMKDS